MTLDQIIERTRLPISVKCCPDLVIEIRWLGRLRAWGHPDNATAQYMEAVSETYQPGVVR